MPVIQVGNFSAIYQPDGDDVNQGPMGEGEATLTYKIASPNGFTLASIPNPLSPHPVYSSLLLFEAKAKREPGAITSVTCTYRGVIVSNPFVYLQEDFTANTTSEPVETHPLFAYPPDAPPVSATELTFINKYLENNLVYTATVTPQSTAIGLLLYNKKRRGITSYLRVGGVYRQTFIQKNIPDNYVGIGRIAANVPKAPVVPQPMNYLWTTYSWRKAGGVVTVSKEWTMSGYQGWDPDLYNPNK